MAFRTNKVPAIEERTVSGSSVSFNSAFALPLKACKVSFSATQASGTPSPSTPLPISGVSAIGLTANSTPVSVSLGEERFGGELDVLTGELTITHVMENITRFTYIGASSSRTPVSFSVAQFHTRVSTVKGMMCNIMKVSNTSADSSADNDILTCRYGTGSNPTKGCWAFFPLSYNITSLSDANTWLSNNPTDLVYELEEPITIQLSANELSSILGNNTFSTDTGTLEITFADLQEKSASGSVATFNTALAMPLSSCNIAVNAWQEGSGDPSPSNVRAIHGFDKTHINMANFNQYINEKTDYDTPQTVNGVTVSRNGNAFTFSGDCVTTSAIILNNNSSLFTPRDIYLAICFKSGWEGENDNWRVFKNGTGTNIYGGNSEYRLFRLPLNWSGGSWNMAVPLVNGKHYDFTFYPQMFNLTQMFGSKVAEQMLTAEQGQSGNGYAMFRQIFYKSWYDYNVGGTWVSVASVNGDSYPDYAEIALGQEVYGAEVDVVNGVAHVTHEKSMADIFSYYKYNSKVFMITNCPKKNGIDNMIFSCFRKGASIGSLGVGQYMGRSDNSSIYIGVDSSVITTIEEFKNWLTSLSAEICYELRTPITIQLTPTQIETIAGKTNTIFADTGDVDLTYKDLDIAKRGNFREVFKLPS